MEGHPLQFHPTLKNECVIGVTCSNQSAFYLNLETSSSLCPELCMTGFGTDVKIEEMDLDSSKFEEHLYEKATIRSELEEAQQFSSLAAGTEQINETVRQFRKLFKIAKDYAAVYYDEMSHASPFPRFRGPTIIQCPACMKPGNTNSRSEFLDLLLHVKKQHPASCSFLLIVISKLYGPLISRMKTKICNRTRKNYSIRLRAEAHPSYVSKQ